MERHRSGDDGQGYLKPIRTADAVRGVGADAALLWSAMRGASLDERSKLANGE